jgi:hypothetical protein
MLLEGQTKKPGGYVRGIRLTNGKLEFVTELEEAVALFAMVRLSLFIIALQPLIQNWPKNGTLQRMVR